MGSFVIYTHNTTKTQNNMNNIKSILANTLLITVGLIWIIGVDSAPIFRVIGFPMFLGAMFVWFKYSNTFKKLSKFMDDGLAGKFDEYYEE